MSQPTADRLLDRGSTDNARWLVTMVDGRTVFAEQAVDEVTAVWLRREHHAYIHLHGPWRPRVLGWHDGDGPLLVLEDLSACSWPPPWTGPRVGCGPSLALVAATPRRTSPS